MEQFEYAIDLNAEDIIDMAKALQKEHGSKAVQVADFFAQEHAKLGDTQWALAWSSVVDHLHDNSSLFFSNSWH